ncbi:dienelactone hydrolase family protein [Brucella sp. 21LCYQ03]|nr:dienelactone hydrolase family protein [Brucella sp. 21LCYQ03]
MTPTNLAAIFFIFVFFLVAICIVGSPTEVVASEREFQRQSQRTSHTALPFRIVQAEHAPGSVVSRKAKPAQYLVILFHGIRGRGSVMKTIGNSWQATLPDTVFVAPDAPFPHRASGLQWFVVDNQVMSSDRIQAARRGFDDTVSDIIKREGFDDALDRVAFVGVSQGAIMALDAVASGRWKVGALVTFAGLLPLPPASSSTRTQIFMMHGGADRTIPSVATVSAASQLKSAGFSVQYKVFPGIGHTISSEQANEAAIFLRDNFK